MTLEEKIAKLEAGIRWLRDRAYDRNRRLLENEGQSDSLEDRASELADKWIATYKEVLLSKEQTARVEDVENSLRLVEKDSNCIESMIETGEC